MKLEIGRYRFTRNQLARVRYSAVVYAYPTSELANRINGGKGCYVVDVLDKSHLRVRSIAFCDNLFDAVCRARSTGLEPSVVNCITTYIGKML